MIPIYTDSLCVESLTVTFPRQHEVITALSDVTLSFAPGSRVAIVGETGSGKSILAGAMLQLLPSGARVTGTIRLGQEQLVGATRARIRDFRREIAALVPQSPVDSLNPMMPVRSQLSEGVRSHEKQDPASEVDRALSTVGFPPRGESAHRYAYQLSGGLAQRAVVAGALARKPRWILADEPTKGLDASLRLRAAVAIERACSETGSGLIVITHDLDVAMRLADRIIVLYAGSVVEDAPADRFFTSPAHPYARGLLASHPARGLHPIPGDPPPAGSRPAGCPFAPRCRSVRAECTERLPAIRSVGPGHDVRCILYAVDPSSRGTDD
jgi:peptide/nickel transport system ATP-binding protein